MAFAKISSKGQITIRGEVPLKAKKRPLTDLPGILQGAVKRPLRVEQMHDAVLQAADEDWARLCSQKD